jgi:hypothetical protein
MKRQIIQLFNPTYQQQGLKIAGQQALKNFYFHKIPQASDSRSEWGILSTPGLDFIADATGALIRAAITYDTTKAYIVIDNKIKKVTSSFVVSDLGVTLGGSTGNCSIAKTGTEVVVCANSKIYRINALTDAVTDITTVLTSINALNIPIWVMAQNSRFIYLTSNSNQVHISDLYNANSITSLNGYRPNTIAGTLSNGAVTTWYQYYFNENSVEVYRDTGAEIGPFSRIDGGAIPVGIAASQSALTILDKVYYLGRTNVGLLGLIEVTDVNYKVVSTPDFVQRIDDYYSYSDAIAWTDTQNGHVFYNLTFPNVELSPGFSSNIGKTWTYDLMTGLFFERSSYDSVNARDTRHKANCSFFLGNKELIGSWDDGKIYEISNDFQDEEGVTIKREIITSTLLDRDSAFTVYNLEIDVERGIALTSGQGSDPILMLETSKDRGNTWSAVRQRSVGVNGDYNKIIRFSSFGMGKSFTWRIRVTDPVKWAFIGATAEIEGTTS